MRFSWPHLSQRIRKADGQPRVAHEAAAEEGDRRAAHDVPLRSRAQDAYGGRGVNAAGRMRWEAGSANAAGGMKGSTCLVHGTVLLFFLFFVCAWNDGCVEPQEN